MAELGSKNYVFAQQMSTGRRRMAAWKSVWIYGRTDKHLKLRR